MLAQSVENWPAVPAHVHVYVADVDASYARALAAGAESVLEPVQREGETDKRGGVIGPGGITWWIATQVE
jgi:PhnB protein